MVDWKSVPKEKVDSIRKALNSLEDYFINSATGIEYQMYKSSLESRPFICTTKIKDQAINTIGLESFKAEVSRGGFNVIWIMDEVFGEVKERIKLDD